MRKRHIITEAVCLCLIGLLAGCGTSAGGNSRIEQAVAALYTSDYDYTRTTKDSYLDTSQDYMGVEEGQRFFFPYKEHVSFPEKSTEFQVDGGQIDAEYYYEELPLGVRALISSGDDWVEQLLHTQPHIPGYGKELLFTYIREETLNGRIVEVYSTQYTLENLEKTFRLSQEVINSAGDALSAHVNQEYYLDKESELLVRIVTDLSEYKKKCAYLVQLSVGASQDDANKARDEVLSQTQTIDFFNIGNATPFTMPY